MRPAIAKSLMLASALMACLAVPQGHATPAPAPASGCVDVALVLAVDASASVSAGEFLLQKRGIAAAFRDPGVQRAIGQAGNVMVSAVFWGSESQPKAQTGWVLADGSSGAEAVARTIEAMPRQISGDTGLGAALVTALVRLTAPELCAARKIINLSGDGEETRQVRGKRRSATAPQARDMAEAHGVEINALAISNEQPDLDRYFSRNVITGPDAFVMRVSDYAGFSEAIKRKLIREISPRVVSGLSVTSSALAP
ncbi:DUF1194 domain-containing protein [Aestuariivirga litoralis]|nr:DUF1194 domain-containing protein [Aestuariivirga litoralis]